MPSQASRRAQARTHQGNSQRAGVPPSSDMHSHQASRRAQARAPHQHCQHRDNMQPAGVPPSSDMGTHQGSQRAQTHAPQRPRPWHDIQPGEMYQSSDVLAVREELHIAKNQNQGMKSALSTMSGLATQQEHTTMQMEINNRCLQSKLGRKLYMANEKISQLEIALNAARKDEEQNLMKEEQIRSLRAEVEASEKRKVFWMNTADRLKATYENELTKLKSTYDTQRSSDLQQMETECQKKVNQLQEQVTEKDNLIDTVKNELSAISSELSLKQTELDQSINKCRALEEKFKEKLAEERKRSEEIILEKDREISSLQETLHAQKTETETVTDSLMKTCDQMKTDFDNELKKLRSTYDTQRSSDLQQMETECQKKVNQLQEQVTEKDNLIDTVRSDHLVISSELSLKQAELDQSINKCQVLEEKFKEELAEREESSETRLKEMEKLWLEKEEALKEKASKAEEDLKLVIAENIRLQEFTLQNKKKTKTKKKKKRGLTREKQQNGSIEEDEATVSPPQDDKKKEKKKKHHGLWCRARKMMSRRHSDTTPD